MCSVIRKQCRLKLILDESMHYVPEVLPSKLIVRNFLNIIENSFRQQKTCLSIVKPRHICT